MKPDTAGLEGFRYTRRLKEITGINHRLIDNILLPAIIGSGKEDITMNTMTRTTLLYSFELESLYFEQGSFSCGNNGRLRMDQ